MRIFMFALVLVISSIADAQEFRLPFNGRWFVMQGGDTPNVNQHMNLAAQWFGIDFAKVSGPSQRELARGAATKVEDFFSWGEPVLAPVDGMIVSVTDGLPDNALGIKDAQHAAGNHVVIKVMENRFVFVAHLQRGSVVVKAGQKIKRGERLGLCGNSGNSDFPHIHMHVQDGPEFNVGHGQNQVFTGMNVELNGKYFSNVSWPLIRGLFVANQ